MKKILLISLASVLISIGIVRNLQADPASKDVALKGSFVWSSQKNAAHDLKAQLTSTGTNEWSAVWLFDWGGKPTKFTGTVKGNLKNGDVSGTGDTPDKRRHWTFTGQAKNGVITFEHYEEHAGKPHNSTGTGELHTAS